jgi:hypothetical protein
VKATPMNAWQRNVCMEYVVDDARASFIKYAVFEKDSKFVNYDLDQDDIEGRCSMAGTDLTNVAEKELKDESEDAEPASRFRRVRPIERAKSPAPQFYSFVDRAFCQSEKVCRRGRG